MYLGMEINGVSRILRKIEKIKREMKFVEIVE